ncbi:MAG TPA: IS1182 family transposase, partial [Candidatus Babeliaceae bacterium]|nr:IS1182 family transposase [Candidatus Babeliaceae bacterium]
MQGHHHFQPHAVISFDLNSFVSPVHLLRKIDRHVDFSFVKQLTMDYYHPSFGRPSVDPEVFFRMIFVGYLYGISSDRDLCEHIHYNIAYRWFCRLNLNDKVPDHSSLTRIRDRLGVETFHRFFLTIVAQCKTKGLVKGERVMTDGTLFQANASLDSLISKMSLNTEDNKIINKRGLHAPPARDISNKTHISKTDPDASLAFKKGTIRSLKYKAHFTLDAESRVILDAKATTGATHESQVYLQQLEQIENDLQITIANTIADRAYGSGEIIQSLLNKKINPTIPLFSHKSGSRASQTLKNFFYDEKNDHYQCPAGHYLVPYPTITNKTIMYHS